MTGGINYSGTGRVSDCLSECREFESRLFKVFVSKLSYISDKSWTAPIELEKTVKRRRETSIYKHAEHILKFHFRYEHTGFFPEAGVKRMFLPEISFRSIN